MGVLSVGGWVRWEGWIFEMYGYLFIIVMQGGNNRFKKEGREAVNVSRAKKADLAKQFEQFKNRIQQFQDKNEQIINRIRQAYTFKKKSFQSKNGSVHDVEHFPRPGFNVGNDAQSIASSCDYSNNIIYDGNIVRHSSNPQHHTTHPYEGEGAVENAIYRQREGSEQQLQDYEQYISSGKSSRALAQGQAYRKDPGGIEGVAMSYAEYMKSVQAGHGAGQGGHRAQRGGEGGPSRAQVGTKVMTENEEDEGDRRMRNKDSKHTGKFFLNEEAIVEIEEKLRATLQKNGELQVMIDAKDEELQRLKSSDVTKWKNYNNSVRRMLSDSLQSFQQQVVSPRLIDLQTKIKKYVNKLKNLHLKLKDTAEDRRAHRTIERSKSKRRLSSKNKWQNSSASSVDMKESSVSGSKENPKLPLKGRPYSSHKQQERSESVSKQKQFQQIAAEYERMIKVKVQQVQKLQRQLREQTLQKQGLSSEVRRVRAMLEEKEQEVRSIGSAKKTPREEQPGDSRELKQAREKVLALQEELQAREQKEKDQLLTIQKLEKSKKALFDEQKDSFNKTIAKKNEAIAELQARIREAEGLHVQQLGALKQRVVGGEKRSMEKECEIMSLSNKLKKVEGDLLLKDEKFRQLQTLILKQSDHGQLLQRSMSVDNSLLTQTEFHALQETLRRVQEELEEKMAVIEQLERQKHQQAGAAEGWRQENQRLLRSVEGLERRVRQASKQSLESRSQANSEKDSNRALQERMTLLEEYEAERAEWVEEREELAARTRDLLEELKRLRDENLTYNRDLIKANSQISFSRDEYASLDAKFARAKDQAADARTRLAEAEKAFKEQEANYILEIKTLQSELEPLKTHLGELEGLLGKGEDAEENLLNSLHVSEVSFSLHPGRREESAREEAALLRQRVRELETNLQMKELMELQIEGEYKSNLEKMRAETGERSREVQGYVAEIEELRKQLKLAQQQQSEDVSFENYKVSLYEDKILQLEVDYNTARNSEQKMNELLHELMENMKEKSEERSRLLEELQARERTIEELRELLDMRGSKQEGGHEGRDLLRQSLSKQYSMRMSQNEQFSEVAELSYLSNISDVFKRDEVLQEKMRKGKTSREQFVKLFTKTAAYIKTLKSIIDAKENRVKALERQVNSLRSTPDNQSWSGGKDKERLSKDRLRDLNFFKTEISDREDDCEEFKDYESVQIDTRRSKSYEIIKELQHEKELAVEENKMLLHQIEMLQEEIAKAEEQENSLVRIKDLYKEEIKKLMDKIEAHNREFEVQTKRLKQEYEGRELFENWEALKQLFLKVFAVISAMDGESNKGKREEKKKQLDEYIKVIASIMRVDLREKEKGISSGKKQK